MEQRRALDKAIKMLAMGIYQLYSVTRPTAIDIRQMAHSEECADAVSVSFFGVPLPNNRL